MKYPMVRPLAAAAALLAAWGVSTPVLAQDAKALQTRALAATCANCHGTNGRPVEGSAVPGLAGLPAHYAAEQMKAFKNGSRPATVMHQLAKGYSDAQIDEIAAWFAAQPR